MASRTSATVREPQPPFENLSHHSRTSATVREPQPPFENLSHRSRTSATVREPQPPFENLFFGAMNQQYGIKKDLIRIKIQMSLD
jgi:hypothetical protein